MEGNRRKEDILSVEKFGEYKTEVKESTESLERPALKKEGGRGRAFRDIREFKRRD